MQDPVDLTDEQLLSIADDPVYRAKLTPAERGRLSALQAGDRGGPVGRYIENAVQPLAQAPGMIATAAESLLPTAGGSQARQDLGRALIDPSVDRLAQAAQANREGRPAAAVGNVLAATPVVGPAVAHGIDQMREGDVAGGAGTLTGIAVPFVAGPATRALGRGTTTALRGTAMGESLADTLDASANRRLVDQMVPKVGPNKTRLGNRAAEVAPALLREPGLSAGSRSGLADKIRAGTEAAADGLDAAADARLVTQQVKIPPLLHQLDAEIAKLTAEPVEASRSIPSVTSPGGSQPAGNILPRDIASGRMMPEPTIAARPFGQTVEPAPNATQLATLRQIRAELERLGPVAPYESVRTIRQAWDTVAKVRYNPATSADFLAKQAEATAAAKGTGAMREGLAATSPADATAYARYSLYKTADDVVQAAEEANRVRPNRGRGIMARTAGAMIGAKEGGVVGAGIGAIIAGIVDRAAEMAPTFQIAIARRMAAVADALRAGNPIEAQAILDRTIARFPAVKSGLKITGKLTPAMSAGAPLPLAAGDDRRRP
jgi:hypothetical protein